jgi:hypothetical protein
LRLEIQQLLNDLKKSQNKAKFRDDHRNSLFCLETTRPSEPEILLTAAQFLRAENSGLGDEVGALSAAVHLEKRFIDKLTSAPTDCDLIGAEIERLRRRTTEPSPKCTSPPPPQTLSTVDRSIFDPFYRQYGRMTEIQGRYHAMPWTLPESVALEKEFTCINMELNGLVLLYRAFEELNATLREATDTREEQLASMEIACRDSLDAIDRREATSTDLLLAALDLRKRPDRHSQFDGVTAQRLEAVIITRMQIAQKLKIFNNWINRTFRFFGPNDGKLNTIKKIRLIRAVLRDRRTG